MLALLRRYAIMDDERPCKEIGDIIGWCFESIHTTIKAHNLTVSDLQRYAEFLDEDGPTPYPKQIGDLMRPIGRNRVRILLEVFQDSEDAVNALHEAMGIEPERMYV
jgi:hypothetical protein